MTLEAGVLASLAAVALLAGDPPGAPGKAPGPDARLSRILDNWHRRSAARSSLEIRCTRLDRGPNWGDESYSGRIVLLPDGQALVEFVKRDAKGKPIDTERCIWTTEAFHRILPERKDHLVWPIGAQDRGRLPAMLALPFLWHVDVERLTSRYSVALLKEESDAWVLSFVPLTEAGRTRFSRAYLQLEKETFLPRRYLWINPDGKSTRDFRLTEARPDPPREEPWEISPEQGWNVTKLEQARPGEAPHAGAFASWFASFLTPDLLP